VEKASVRFFRTVPLWIHQHYLLTFPAHPRRSSRSGRSPLPLWAPGTPVSRLFFPVILLYPKPLRKITILRISTFTFTIALALEPQSIQARIGTGYRRFSGTDFL
jgi:hypothetical protein